MSAGDLLVTLAALLCALGFAALIVVLVRVLDSLRLVRQEVESLRRQVTPLISELREHTDLAREAIVEATVDLQRFDRVLGSAEAISEAVEGSSRVARTAFSAPVIKIAGAAAGTRSAVRRLRSRDPHAEITSISSIPRGRSS